MRIRLLRATLSVALLLGGCQRDGHSIDAFGCPDLTGQYVASSAGSGAMFEERPFVSMPVQAWLLSARSASGVAIERAGPDGFRFRWTFDEASTQERFEWLRDAHPDDYAAWYRNATTGATLPASAAQRIPVGDHTVTIERNKDYTCHDGRVAIGELRLYREDGALVGERTHLTGPEVDVWCGDGCKGFTVPTGTTRERVRWPSGVATPWVPDPQRLGRPQADIVQERAEYERGQSIEAARAFAPAEVIERRIQALASPGTRVTSVRFEGGYRVHVEFDAPKGHEPWLLRAVNEANGTARGPEHVETTVTVGRDVTHTRFTLEESPIVAPEAAVVTDASAASGDLVPLPER